MHEIKYIIVKLINLTIIYLIIYNLKFNNFYILVIILLNLVHNIIKN